MQGEALRVSDAPVRARGGLVQIAVGIPVQHVSHRLERG
jgi:hypothetical protein